MWQAEIMLVLMLIAFYGLIGVFTPPGAILAAMAGGILLGFLPFYMAGYLAGDATGLLLVALFVIDVFAAAHGMVTGCGVIALFFGGLIFFHGGRPFFFLLVHVFP